MLQQKIQFDTAASEGASVAGVVALVTGAINQTAPGLRKEVAECRAFADIAERMLVSPFKSENAALRAAAADLQHAVTSFIKTEADKAAILQLSQRLTRDPEIDEAAAKALGELLQPELNGGSLRDLYQPQPELLKALLRYTSELVSDIAPLLTPQLLESRGAQLLTLFSAYQVEANYVGLCAGADLPTADATNHITPIGQLQFDLDVTVSALVTEQLLQRFGHQGISLRHLSHMPKSIPNKYKLDTLFSALDLKGDSLMEFASLFRRLADARSEVSDAAKLLERRTEGEAVAPDVAALLNSSGIKQVVGVIPTVEALQSELSFGQCDTGVILLDSARAMSCNYFKTKPLVGLAFADGQREGTVLDTTDIRRTELTPWFSNVQPGWVGSDGLAVAGPLIGAATSAVMDQTKLLGQRETALYGAAALGQLWEQCPLLLSELGDKGPVYLVVEAGKRFLLVPEVGAAVVQKHLGEGSDAAPIEKLISVLRRTGLETQGNQWTILHVPEPRREQPVSPGEPKEEKPGQYLRRVFLENGGIPTYPEFVGMLKKDFDVIEKRSEGKGSHGALLRDCGEDGQARATTCTSVRDRTDSMKIWVLLSMLESLKIKPEEFALCVG